MKHRLSDMQVKAKDFQTDIEVEILPDDLYSLAWQSGFELFFMIHNQNPNKEPTIVPIDNGNNTDYEAHDVVPDVLPNNNPVEQETQPETNPNPEPSSPGKESITYEVTPLQTGKTIMLTTTQ